MIDLILQSFVWEEWYTSLPQGPAAVTNYKYVQLGDQIVVIPSERLIAMEYNLRVCRLHSWWFVWFESHSRVQRLRVVTDHLYSLWSNVGSKIRFGTLHSSWDYPQLSYSVLILSMLIGCYQITEVVNQELVSHLKEPSTNLHSSRPFSDQPIG
ncbi:hypothetical protein ES702_03434 [subsurface metagenome]